MISQSLADQVWEHMQQGLGGKLRKRPMGMRSADTGDVLGLAPYQNVLRHWMAQGEAKRQRTAQATPEASQVPAGSPVVIRPKAASRPPPPPPRSKGVGKGPPPPAKASAPFAPVARIVANAANAGNYAKPLGDGKVAMNADMLMQQRAGLRKVQAVADHSGKENARPDCGSVVRKKSPKSPENVVLRRLRERRRVVADTSPRTEEFTQTTGWLPTH